ncbi:MAG: amidohydrolase family protein [Sulfuricurvum sp.]
MVISGAIICDVYGERSGDVRIQNGVVVEIGDHLEDEEVIDASGCYLLPGLIDTNVRVKDAQLNGKNLESLARHALEGGVTTAVVSGDSTPRVDNVITSEFVQKHRCLPNGATLESAVSALNEAGAISNIAIMLKKGSVAVDMSTISDYNLISRIAQYVKMADKTLFYKAEDKSLSESGVMAEGAVAGRLGLPGISPMSEIVHIASMIEIARHFGIKIVFKSVTEPRAIELIANAADEGIQVGCDVAIHHLFKSDEACLGFDTDAKLTPPLVNETKRKYLIDAVEKGIVNTLSALHQPNSDVFKDITFYDANYGTTSISEYLPLCYTYLVDKKLISMSRLMELASQKPGEQIGIRSGVVELGGKADLIVFNPTLMTEVTHHHSLYKGEALKGKVVAALCRGELTQF